MCAFANDVRTLVEEKVSNGDHFTAFDITTDLRKKSPAMNIPHKEVRSVVHEMFRDGEMGDDYITTPIKFPGAPRAAILYHDTAFAITSFMNQLNKVVQTNSPSLPASSGTKEVFISSDDRIYVPSDVCRTASFYPGDEGLAEASSRSITIRKPYPGEEPNCTVDCKGNLRVRKDVIFRVTRARTANASVVFEVSLEPNSTIKLTQK
jgi:hypothetical protein